MKHFVISLSLLALTFALVCANAFFVRTAADELIALAQSLSAEYGRMEESARVFAEKWYSLHDRLSISLHDCELERVCDAVCDLLSAAENGDNAAFITAKNRVSAALYELADGERQGFFNVF